MKKPVVSALTRPYRGAVAALCVLTVLQSLLQVGMAVLSKYVIDAALRSGEKLLLWGALLGLDIGLIVIVHSVLAYLSGSTSDHLAASLRASLLRAAVYSRDVRLAGFHSGQLLSRGMEDAAAVCDGIVSVLPAFVGQVARLVTAFAAAALIAPGSFVILAAVAVLTAVLASSVRPALKRRQRGVREADEAVVSTMQESLQQLELIQSLDVQEPIVSRFESCQKNSLKQRRRRRILSVGVNSAVNAGALAGSGLLLLWGAVAVSDGQLSYGSLTAMIQLLALVRGPILGISGIWLRLASVDVAAERLSDLMETPPRETPQQAERVEAIVFENVTFSYPGSDRPVLQDFSAVLPLKPWCCITGVSGRGKSTMFKLILGLYTPQSGAVYLQTDQGRLPCGSNTRHLFAYVPQDYALFSGTIRENLELVSCDGERTASSLETAQAQFVNALPDGLQTPVRENNTGLSKGQLQRLAIARAVAMDRPILLLDECTGALDAQTEEAVLSGLYQGGRQALLVTHRPEALENLPDVAAVSL